MSVPEDDKIFSSYNEMLDDICMTLGGRVAEELVIKDVTQGASADLRHVTNIARRMITQYGMSEELGLVAYDSDQPVFMGMEYGHSESKYSQETAAKIDAEIRRLTAEAHERATKLLQENRSILDNMARVLVEKETIYTEEVKMLMKGASYQEVLDAMDGYAEERKNNPFAFAGGVKSENEASDEKEEKSDETAETSVDVVSETPDETAETSETAETPDENTDETENKDEE